MGMIKKRGNKYVLIYYFNDNGKGKQKWETFATEEEAKVREAEVESGKIKKTFVVPKVTTVREFLKEYVELYGTKNWALTTYSCNLSLIDNYINPYIGDQPLQNITALDIERYYNNLANSKAVNYNHLYADKPVSVSNMHRVHVLLKGAFKMAVNWDLIYTNPFDKVTAPKYKKEKREIWTSDQIITALEACTDSRLSLCIHLSFACSLRLGEILGLTWDNVYIDDEHMENDDAYIYIDKQLEKTTKEALKVIKSKDVMFVFPAREEVQLRLVLKTPKTQSSIRKIWLPKNLAVLLKEWKEYQQKQKEFLQEEYKDYNLVICFEDGRPLSPRYVDSSFEKLIKKTGLPKVVFHSLRHSSTTYKLKLNHGDIKATQGDTGHSQANMVMDVYSHILDEDRKINAQKFNQSFYNGEESIDYRGRADIDKLVNAIKEDPNLMKKLIEIMDCKDTGNGSQKS